MFRVVLERETALPDLETWLRNLQTMAADGGQGMVNNLVDSLWAFKLRATAAHVYDLAVRLDMYPRNFSRFVEKGASSCSFLCSSLCCVLNTNSILTNFSEECHRWKNCTSLYSMFSESLM